MEYLNADALYMPMLTALGAVSLFPEPPQVFKDLAANELVRYLFVFVLIMQGGAGGNVQLAVVATVVLYVLVKVLDMVYANKQGYY